MLPGGRMVQGRIIDGCNEPTGGWLLINLGPHDVALGQSASLKGWTWE